MTQRNEDLSQAGSAPGLGTPDPALRGNDSDSHTLYPTFFDASTKREEVSLLFGKERPSGPGNPERTIDLTERIILSPFVAKRLALALDSVLRDHESKFGPLAPEFPPAGREVSAPGKKSSPELSARLLELIKTLAVPAEFEHSFKLVRGRILQNRFLAGVSMKVLSNPEEHILAICGQMGMPENLRGVFKKKLADANFIHFGFEGDERTCLYKVYLEFLDRVREEIHDNRGDRTPRLLHLAFKWDAAENTRQAVTSYTLHPWLSVSEMVSRAADTLASKSEDKGIVEDVIGLAAERISPDDLLYLEVTEEGNPRRSFDINMYRTKLQVGELYPWLGRIARRQAIPYRDFHALYEPIKGQTFGHLAGGVGRDGREFFTVYYGAALRFHGEGRDSAILPQAARVPPRPMARKAGIPGAESAFVSELLQTLNVPVATERSFKLLDRTLLTERLLLGFRRKAVPDHERILDICRRLNMPADFLEAFHGSLPEADILLFGYEEDPTNPLCKAYLEFSHKLGDAPGARAGAREKSKPILMIMGFKWGARDATRKVRTNYNCFPFFPVDDMFRRLAGAFYGSAMRPPGRIVEEVLAVVASRTPPDGLLYFEAKEEENPRSSFDVNVYRANLHLMEIYPFLLAMARHYSAPLDRFHALYDEIKDLLFGHLQGGVDRKGRDFLTIYFSEKGSSPPNE